jgi:hypothetical protein
MLPSRIHKDDVEYPPDGNYPLYVTARRYRVAGCKPDEDALTLVLLHSTSFHKETWEPTLERIFDRLNSAQGRIETPKIAEVWSIEAPNHGRSAVLNEQSLLRPEFHNNCASFFINLIPWPWGVHAISNRPHFIPMLILWCLTVSCLKYAHAAHRFLTAGSEHGAKIDFSKRNLVAIGHSLGGVTMSVRFLLSWSVVEVLRVWGLTDLATDQALHIPYIHCSSSLGKKKKN